MDLLCFQMRMSVCQPSVLQVMSSDIVARDIVARSGAFSWHNIIFFEAMFLLQLISIFLISVTFYTYLTNIVFFMQLGLQVILTCENKTSDRSCH